MVASRSRRDHGPWLHRMLCTLCSGTITTSVAYGDVTAAFAAAHATVALELKIGRHSGVPLETRGAIARLDIAHDVLELYGAAKVSFHRTSPTRARSTAVPRRR